ncbi:restriction endonuclease, SacI family [Kamptonema sp. UHCC 0994]|uniref:restriction endonuclease, SacI family n=1 Tax=Kamptonema sp. UHCC 0994 TaxID=3031329 RepID=UPI0023BB0E4B|nr:restriction endonuclease, SacI family [Kamptonema sp. UHCC 0994]MDF0556663.1 restriction endonuclease, SacI family [Kamptonema sp. UHCC 0994]
MSFAKPTVDQKAAEQLLREAIAIAQDDSREIPAVEWDIEIRTIIQGTHLTFRYILMTGLLGKATNPSINALALQAGADVEGAYDARTLCHQVVVPIERKLLNRALGGSNEPFANNPARLPTISLSNPVRRGKDQKLQSMLYKVLSEIGASDQAFVCLCNAVRYAIKKQMARSGSLPQLSESADSHLKTIEFIDAFVTRSIEGQVAAIVAGTVLSIYFDQFEGFEVIVHPVNQSGSSSKEVADIDIKKNGKIFVVVEVKDKPFSEQDVDHAAFKVSQYSLTSITFVIGVNGTYIGSSLKQVSKTVLLTRNVNVIFVSLLSFMSSVIALCPELSFATFLAKLRYYAINARVKDEVFEHIESVFQSMQVASNPPSNNPSGAD